MKKQITLLALTLVILGLKAQVVTTFAGSGVQGSADGTTTAASFNKPFGICVDRSGNFFVTDSRSSLIRKITSAGVVTTFSYSGIPLNPANPNTMLQGICVDASGNLYVVDSNGYKIIKVTPSGVATVFAGSGVSGSADGTGTAAEFNLPNGICIDASGNLYVTDFGNNKIRKITSSGVVTTFAGGATSGPFDGTGTMARFGSPQGICIDASGDIYVTEYYAGTIRKITPNAVVTTFAGDRVLSGSYDGTGSSARFTFPAGICSDLSGNLYVSEANGLRIRKINPSAVVTTLTNTGASGAPYYSGVPTGICLYSNELYTADSYNNSIRRFTLPVPAGIEDIKTQSELVSVYPNPSNGLFVFELKQPSHVSVTNILGEVILSETMTAEKHSIDLQSKASGTYLVKVEQGNKQQLIKLIKE